MEKLKALGNENLSKYFSKSLRFLLLQYTWAVKQLHVEGFTCLPFIFLLFSPIEINARLIIAIKRQHQTLL